MESQFYISHNGDIIGNQPNSETDGADGQIWTIYTNTKEMQMDLLIEVTLEDNQ